MTVFSDAALRVTVKVGGADVLVHAVSGALELDGGRVIVVENRQRGGTWRSERRVARGAQGQIDRLVRLVVASLRTVTSKVRLVWPGVKVSVPLVF